MELIESRRAQIKESIARAREGYPQLWRDVIHAWTADGSSDALWLTYAANYLFKTGGLQWALDPFSLSARVEGVEPPDYAADFQSCSLIVLSHQHADHLDLNLVRAVQHLPIHWVIPEAMIPILQQQADLPARRVSVARHGAPLHFDGLTLNPFMGLHINGNRGVPSTGYLAEWSGKRWLIPGDTRVYDRTLLPEFGRLDGVIAHLWLGRGKALEEQPALTDDFCQFFLSFHAPRILVTHLDEFGRDAAEYWDRSHYERIKAALLKRAPNLEISSARMGEKALL